MLSASLWFKLGSAAAAPSAEAAEAEVLDLASRRSARPEELLLPSSVARALRISPHKPALGPPDLREAVEVSMRLDEEVAAAAPGADPLDAIIGSKARLASDDSRLRSTASNSTKRRIALSKFAACSPTLCALPASAGELASGALRGGSSSASVAASRLRTRAMSALLRSRQSRSWPTVCVTSDWSCARRSCTESSLRRSRAERCAEATSRSRAERRLEMSCARRGAEEEDEAVAEGVDEVEVGVGVRMSTSPS